MDFSKSLRVRVLVICCLAVASVPFPSLQASPKPKEAPVTVEFVSPDPQRPNPKFGDELPLVTTSGWVLGLKLEAPDVLGIGQIFQTGPYPISPGTGYLVFDDPDGCFSPLCQAFGPGVCGLEPTGACPPADETLVEYSTDLDAPGLPDSVGNDAARLLLSEPAPILNTFDPATSTNTLPIEIGPEAYPGEFSVLDGYGHGADDDLPGLVILIDSGFGLEFDAEDLDLDGDRAEVRGARNLAGFINQVGYTLSGSRHSGINLHAEMVVPPDLTRARILLDESLAPDGCAGGQVLIRVNGGDPIPLERGSLPVNTDLIPDGLDVPFDPLVTIRAFVVNGLAPGRLSDLDGNGVFDFRDAALAGYQVISNEAVIQVEQYYQRPDDLVSPARYDIDGDGFAFCKPDIGPGGPGTITPPPR